MTRVKVIDTTMNICFKIFNNVIRIETDPDTMTAKISYISSEISNPIKHEIVKVGPNDTNKVVIF